MRETIDRQLSSLDGSVVMLRAKAKSSDALLAAFASMAATIRYEADEDAQYVNARLRSIAFANGLDVASTRSFRPQRGSGRRNRLIVMIRRACAGGRLLRGASCTME